jgi:hypothetical protein
MAKIRTQADRRKHAVFTDQFGRKWETEIEKDTMHPCTAVTPKGWREADGCVTPDIYKTYPKIDDPFAMVINLEDWIQHLEERQRDYEQTAANTAMYMSPDDNGARLFRSAEDGTIFIARALRNIIGPIPAPPDLVRAMRAGNKWALGLINPETRKPYPRPKWADKFFPVVAAPKDEFPDEYEDDEDAGGFEDAVPEEAARFPDEEGDRPEEDEPANDEPPNEPGDLDADDPFSHLANVATKVQKAPVKTAPPKPAPKAAKKAAPKPKPIPKPATSTPSKE